MRAGQIDLLDSDMADWTITFVDTGLESPIGERLRRVRKHLGGAPSFLANYTDVLTDAPLATLIARLPGSDAAASMLIVPPQSSFHCVDAGSDGDIKEI